MNQSKKQEILGHHVAGGLEIEKKILLQWPGTKQEKKKEEMKRGKQGSQCNESKRERERKRNKHLEEEKQNDWKETINVLTSWRRT